MWSTKPQTLINIKKDIIKMVVMEQDYWSASSSRQATILAIGNFCYIIGSVNQYPVVKK